VIDVLVQNPHRSITHQKRNGPWVSASETKLCLPIAARRTLHRGVVAAGVIVQRYEGMHETLPVVRSSPAVIVMIAALDPHLTKEDGVGQAVEDVLESALIPIPSASEHTRGIVLTESYHRSVGVHVDRATAVRISVAAELVGAEISRIVGKADLGRGAPDRRHSRSTIEKVGGTAGVILLRAGRCRSVRCCAAGATLADLASRSRC